MINNVLDIGHKVFRPDWYSYNLCAITHNTFSENNTWKHFREQNKYDMVFYHLDEFEQEFQNQVFTYPVVLLKPNSTLTEFLSSTELNRTTSAEELIGKLVDNFQKYKLV